MGSKVVTGASKNRGAAEKITPQTRKKWNKDRKCPEEKQEKTAVTAT